MTQGEAVGHQAEVDGVEAVEEARGPDLGVLGRLGVHNLAGLAEHLVDAVLPVLDITIVDGAVSSVLGGRHRVRWLR